MAVKAVTNQSSPVWVRVKAQLDAEPMTRLQSPAVKALAGLAPVTSTSRTPPSGNSSSALSPRTSRLMLVGESGLALTPPCRVSRSALHWPLAYSMFSVTAPPVAKAPVTVSRSAAAVVAPWMTAEVARSMAPPAVRLTGAWMVLVPTTCSSPSAGTAKAAAPGRRAALARRRMPALKLAAEKALVWSPVRVQRPAPVLAKEGAVVSVRKLARSDRLNTSMPRALPELNSRARSPAETLSPEAMPPPELSTSLWLAPPSMRMAWPEAPPSTRPPISTRMAPVASWVWTSMPVPAAAVAVTLFSARMVMSPVPAVRSTSMPAVAPETAPVAVMSMLPEPAWSASMPMASWEVMAPLISASMPVEPLAPRRSMALPRATRALKSLVERICSISPEAASRVWVTVAGLLQSKRPPVPEASMQGRTIMAPGMLTSEMIQLPAALRARVKLRAVPSSMIRVPAVKAVAALVLLPETSMSGAWGSRMRSMRVAPVTRRVTVEALLPVVPPCSTMRSALPSVKSTFRLTMPPVVKRPVMAIWSRVPVSASETMPELASMAAWTLLWVGRGVAGLRLLACNVLAPMSRALPGRKVAPTRRRVPAAKLLLVKASALAWLPVRVQVPAPDLAKASKSEPDRPERAKLSLPVPASSRVVVPEAPVAVMSPPMLAPVESTSLRSVPPDMEMAVPPVPVTRAPEARVMVMSLPLWAVVALMPMLPVTRAPVLRVMARLPLPAWSASMPRVRVPVMATPAAAVTVRALAAVALLLCTSMP